MIRSIEGVWEITSYGEDTAAAETISLPKGENLQLLVSVKRNDGTVPDLTGSTLYFRLVDFNLSEIYRASASADRLGSAELSVAVPAFLQSGTYSWDLWLTHLGSNYQIKPLAAFKLLNSTRSLP